MQPDENTSIKKYINRFVNIISLISSVITILSFYGYNNTKHLTFILLGTLFIILTISLFANREKISQRLEIKYKKFTKQTEKLLMSESKNMMKQKKLIQNFYELYDRKTIEDFLNILESKGHPGHKEFAVRFRYNLDKDNINIHDICTFNDIFQAYKDQDNKNIN